MDKKDPIPFRAKSREKRLARMRPGRSAGPQSRQNPPNGGELDEVKAYWQHFIRAPLGGKGRFYWTDRMLWGNAILTGLLAMIVSAFRVGFHPLTLITAGINLFFIFVLVYYLLPWVTYFLMSRMGVRQASVDQVKLAVIMLSGWVTIALLLGLVPRFQPFLSDAGLLWFAILLYLAVKRTHKSRPLPAALATLGGLLSVLLVQMLLTYL